MWQSECGKRPTVSSLSEECVKKNYYKSLNLQLFCMFSNSQNIGKQKKNKWQADYSTVINTNHRTHLLITQVTEVDINCYINEVSLMRRDENDILPLWFSYHRESQCHHEKNIRQISIQRPSAKYLSSKTWNLKFIGNKENLRHCGSVEEPKEVWGQNVTWHRGWDLGTEADMG